MLNNIKIAFIGGGNMATAMIQGLLRAGLAPAHIRVAEPSGQRRQELADQFVGISVLERNQDAVVKADQVIIAVKPGMVTKVLAEISPNLATKTVVISIAAGIPLATLAHGLPPGQLVVRVMPNTPALIGAGISVILPAAGVPAEAVDQVRQTMATVGEVAVVDNEAWIDGVTALSGSGPAYVFLMAEALSDGGVACGLPRALADQLAVQTLIGSARLLAASGKHPGELKNQVTSPGGTTIAGLAVLERAGVRGALIDTVVAAWRRAKELNPSS